MSVTAINWARQQTCRTASAKFVLIMIADLIQGDECFPSLDTLARFTQLTKRSVIRSIKHLVEDGQLKVEHRRGDKRRHLSNLYRLNIRETLVTPVHPPSDTEPLTQVTQSHPNSSSSLQKKKIRDDVDRKRRPTTKMSEDWQPSDKSQAYAELNKIDLQRMLPEFRLYWLDKPAHADWDLAFRHRIDWCRERNRFIRQETTVARIGGL
jgi:DNA-binding transcriptional regulator GbsR (MarR family)